VIGRGLKPLDARTDPPNQIKTAGKRKKNASNILSKQCNLVQVILISSKNYVPSKYSRIQTYFQEFEILTSPIYFKKFKLTL
jgi:hypothetical protein